MLAATDPIVVTDVSNRRALTADAFSIVLKAHRREGYDAGYRRAIADVLAASVFVAEKALLTTADRDDARQVIYRFIELLESETLRNARSDEYVDGQGFEPKHDGNRCPLSRVLTGEG